MAKPSAKQAPVNTHRREQPKPRVKTDGLAEEEIAIVKRWLPSYSYILLGVLTLACLLPFSGRAFHVDDTLFVLAAQQISRHPLDPYGFNLIWNKSVERMADVTKNPPLACYYGAAVGAAAGWSERAFHLAFLVPALALVLGTYNLARHFTRFPVLAAAVTLLTPGVLVSASSVMCDTMMLALWVLAAILWVKGLEPRKPLSLVGSGLLIAASALTKYFGASLILLLAAYSFARLRRLGSWMWYLLIPVAALVGYQLWTQVLYGQGLLSGAAEYAGTEKASGGAPLVAMVLVALSFTGGCVLSVLTLSPQAWSRKVLSVVVAVSGLMAFAVIAGWVDLGRRVGKELAFAALRQHWALVGSQLTLCIAGGIFTLALAIGDFRKRRDADSLFLVLWLVGTFVFAGFVNWTINARSLLPLIPAAGVLVARRLETMQARWTRGVALRVAGALAISAVLSVWLAGADAGLANLTREAVQHIQAKTSNERGTLWYEGHWGFQYYMEQLGARPVDAQNLQVRAGDLVVIPENNTTLVGRPTDLPFLTEVMELHNPRWATTIGWKLGAGFYSSHWGPLPFAFGPVPSERYFLLRVGRARK